jgi:threonine dehydratase
MNVTGPSYKDCAEAHALSSEIARRTPTLTSASLSERCGGTIVLKAECLQRTGSFKLRGALNKLRAISEPGAPVVAGSAGNHAQSLAYAARHYGRGCEVFMPTGASVSKSAAVRAFGATVHLEADSVDDCVALARERARTTGAVFVHPFDDNEIITGQAGVGIEVLADVPDLAKIIVPIGGGGLASGVALAVKSMNPAVEVVGVQAAACAPVSALLRGDAADEAAIRPTIADGIAIKRPGGLTLPLIERWIDHVVVVDDESIAEAMVVLLERSKLVVEGAGATGVAALLSGVVEPAEDGATVAILSGGNVDPELLGKVAVREETRAGRRRRLFTRVPDRPGGLAGLVTAVAANQANVLTVEHVRDGVDLGVRETGLVLTVEGRGRAHLDALVDELRSAGYYVGVES